MNKIYFIINFTFLLITFSFISNGQIITNRDISSVKYNAPQEYEIGGITISGAKFLDHTVLLTLSNLRIGEKIQIPGEKITTAIEKLWAQGLFSDVNISIVKILGEKVFLDIYLEEKPRLSYFTFKGIKKHDAEKLREEIKLEKGNIITENVILKTKSKIEKYFISDGYSNTSVKVIQKEDSNSFNKVSLIFSINKGQKTRIKNIYFSGNSSFSSGKLKLAMKETKEKSIFRPFYDFKSTTKLAYNFLTEPYNFPKDSLSNYLSKRYKLRVFKPSKFITDDYSKDKSNILKKYNEKGFRDARILNDSVVRLNSSSVKIYISLEEGRKYYFRNISWIGNTKYTAEFLTKILNIKKGDVYNQEELETKLYMNPNGLDISSLYLDDGYLFFSVTPTEILVENDSIDLQMRVYEGKQATINKIIIKGNTKTNDHVILREIRTKPGQLFKRSDIIRSQRELANLGYFDPEKLNVNPIPDPVSGTVDIEYIVEEKPSDQVELSGGWGQGRVVGTLGLGFNNFSLKSIFKKDAWRPLPAGDGQRLSLRASSNGTYFRSYNLSFTEPWLGGKKPNSLTFSIYNSLQNYSGKPRKDPGRQSIDITGVSVGLGKRLKWPDDYFTIYHSVTFQNYTLDNFLAFRNFTNGTSKNINYNIVIGRSSTDSPIFTRDGSQFSLSAFFTPPYSLFSNKDYNNMESSEKYKWTEYHKWNFNAALYKSLVGKFVLNTRIAFGFLGAYNKEIGITPFERYYVGGDGLTGYSLDGREIISLRGYENSSLTPTQNGSEVGATIYNKYTIELRYPFSLNPSATIYGLVFAEAGNAWLKFKDFNPFEIRRSLGVGVRIFMPMFGLLGFDWGYGYDEIPWSKGSNKGNFHFTIGQQF